MEKVIKKLKSNKGFTMQDVIIGMVILTIFAGTIAGSYLAIYKIQAQTQMTAVASLYGIQILENIDRIAYEDVKNGMEDNYKQAYNISDKMDLKIEVSPYGTEDTLKMIRLTLTYEIAGNTEELVLEKLKVKEI
ncbi:MAG: hypothetical protein HFJ30_05350 [Clostridia bacterium]|jgi:Tfp pilus assembly protein PilE|nr:hypothetical protein [Clostridia bacterium]